MTGLRLPRLQGKVMVVTSEQDWAELATEPQTSYGEVHGLVHDADVNVGSSAALTAYGGVFRQRLDLP